MRLTFYGASETGTAESASDSISFISLFGITGCTLANDFGAALPLSQICQLNSKESNVYENQSEELRRNARRAIVDSCVIHERLRLRVLFQWWRMVSGDESC